MNRIDMDAVPAWDATGPVATKDVDALAAITIAEARLSRAVSADQLRAIGLGLMRCGPPVGWLGALLVVESNRMSSAGATTLLGDLLDLTD